MMKTDGANRIKKINWCAKRQLDMKKKKLKYQESQAAEDIQTKCTRLKKREKYLRIETPEQQISRQD